MLHRVLSADGHIDVPCLPERLFVERAPERLRSRMPHVIETEEGRIWVADEGARFGFAGGMGSAGRKYVPGQIQRADRMAQTGLYEDQAKGILRTTDPELRLLDQDRDGVVGEVIYGILGAAHRVRDREIAAEMGRIYNDFAAEFGARHPARFAMIACLPGLDPPQAAAEVRRVAALGLRGVELPVSHSMMPLWHPDWEPLWRAVAECRLPLHLHSIGGSTDLKWVRGQGQQGYQKWLASYMTCFQLQMADHLAAIVFGGALERYPEARVVIGEAGLGWIPYVLERMDYEWEDQFRDLELRVRPSEYWGRQMHATFQQDATGLALLDRIGVDNILWGSDFPHPDGLWPDSLEHLERMLGSFPERVSRKIAYENTARLYGFPALP